MPDPDLCTYSDENQEPPEPRPDPYDDECDREEAALARGGL